MRKKYDPFIISELIIDFAEVFRRNHTTSFTISESLTVISVPFLKPAIMISFTRKLLDQLEEDIRGIENAPGHKLEKARLSYSKAKLAAADLIAPIWDHHFASRDEEIAFFKIYKPQLFAKLFYYKNLQQLEGETFGQNEHHRKKVFIQKLFNIEQFREHNAEAYNYFRKRRSDQDEMFFTRMCSSKTIERDTKPSEIQFCPYGLIFSKIMASKILEEYIIKELFYIIDPNHAESKKVFEVLRNLGIFWTGKLRDLVELLSALQKIKVINNGNVNLKNLFEISSCLFNIDFEMRDIYSARQQIKMRKKQESSFLEKLKNVSDEVGDEYFEL